ncbi:unnamed protein product [Cylicocyclus nassatus]|uniref:G-protein coupled receptors family 1 profile domain-containing protein n=1 Tax=Cylicocyclus nassatus TaxID=53992 RepID=A0AA36MA05_CYLNA|nr:unnamed protein product [Cylicocyclus nassatus]
MCNPPNALQETVKDIWYKIAFVLCGVTLFSYALAFVVLSYKHYHRKDRKHETARKSMRSLTVIFSTFLCTRFITILIANALNIVHVDPDYIELCQMYSAVTAMMSYSLNFYVIFWRSRDHREHLRQQQRKLLKHLFGTCFKFAAKSIFTSNQSVSTSVNNTTVISLRQR